MRDALGFEGSDFSMLPAPPRPFLHVSMMWGGIGKGGEMVPVVKVEDLRCGVARSFASGAGLGFAETFPAPPRPWERD